MGRLPGAGLGGKLWVEWLLNELVLKAVDGDPQLGKVAAVVGSAARKAGSKLVIKC
jgi:hypothetical protein